MMIFYANLAALFLLVMLGGLLPPTLRQIVSLVLYSAYAVEAWWPLRLLVKAQRSNGKSKSVNYD